MVKKHKKNELFHLPVQHKARVRQQTYLGETCVCWLEANDRGSGAQSVEELLWSCCACRLYLRVTKTVGGHLKAPRYGGSVVCVREIRGYRANRNSKTPWYVWQARVRYRRRTTAHESHQHISQPESPRGENGGSCRPTAFSSLEQPVTALAVHTYIAAYSFKRCVMICSGHACNRLTKQHALPSSTASSCNRKPHAVKEMDGIAFHTGVCTSTPQYHTC